MVILQAVKCHFFIFFSILLFFIILEPLSLFHYFLDNLLIFLFFSDQLPFGLNDFQLYYVLHE